MTVQVIKRSQLPLDGIARELVGQDHGGVEASILFVDAAPGEGPRLHRHPYPEIFITLEGHADFTVGDQHLSAVAGDVAIVPAGTPHAFTSSGPGHLIQIDIHLSPSFITEWL